MPPTDHRPGSPGKILIMTGRASRREPLFQPGDSRDARPQPKTKGGSIGPHARLPRGVSYHEGRGMYKAQRELFGVRQFLGWHATAALAAAAVAR